jgi:hypothetical protein
MFKGFGIALLSSVAQAGINGTTFFVIGDYGDVTKMAVPNMVFDAMDAAVGTATNGIIDQPDFIVSTGDAMYPAVDAAPTDTEFANLLSLF